MAKLIIVRVPYTPFLRTWDPSGAAMTGYACHRTTPRAMFVHLQQRFPLFNMPFQ